MARGARHAPRVVAKERASLQSRNGRHGGKRDAASVSHMHPILSVQHRLVAMRLRRRKADKIARIAGPGGPRRLESPLGGLAGRRRSAPDLLGLLSGLRLDSFYIPPAPERGPLADRAACAQGFQDDAASDGDICLSQHCGGGIVRVVCLCCSRDQLHADCCLSGSRPCAARRAAASSFVSLNAASDRAVPAIVRLECRDLSEPRFREFMTAAGRVGCWRCTAHRRADWECPV